MTKAMLTIDDKNLVNLLQIDMEASKQKRIKQNLNKVDNYLKRFFEGLLAYINQ